LLLAVVLLSIFGEGRAMAAEISSNNSVSSGTQERFHFRPMTEEEKTYWTERTLLKRVGEPGDIAGPILFLASDEARYITGATLQVDGGTRLLV
jgi:NAD(P)-dependent dehydrogenase (short-subunit alcohol dehydrogenase family)